MNNIRNFLIAALMVITVGACSKPAEISYSEDRTDIALAELPVTAVGNANPSLESQTPDNTIVLPQLAYAYNYSFQAPAATFDTFTKHHQAVCDKAGPQHCQIISASSMGDKSAGEMRKTLELRISPQWLKTFQTGLDSDLTKARARVISQDVTSEDLSLQIVDSEARLKNKTALRDRLIEIIKSKPGKIADLIEAETTLSNVQGDIDSLQSSLAVMRKRVATAKLTLHYGSSTLGATSSSFQPVTDAWNNFTLNVMTTLGFLIDLLAALLPTVIILGPAAWFSWKWWSKRRKIKSASQTET